MIAYKFCIGKNNGNVMPASRDQQDHHGAGFLMQEQRFLYSNPGKDHAQHSSTAGEGERPRTPITKGLYREKPRAGSYLSRRFVIG